MIQMRDDGDLDQYSGRGASKKYLDSGENVDCPNDRILTDRYRYERNKGFSLG